MELSENLNNPRIKEKINNNDNFQLIDVRDEYEFDDFNIGCENIPMGTILSSLNLNRDVVFCCNSGKRSAAIAHTLERKFQMRNLFSLSGSVVDF